MPKFTTEKSKSRFVEYVDASVLEAYRNALKRASEVGLRVDVTRDVESLLRKLTKIVLDAVSEQASCVGDEKVNAPSSVDGEHSRE